MSDSARRADELMLTIFTVLADGLKSKLSEEESIELSQKVVDDISHTFSGEAIYIGKGRSVNSMIMSNNIWSDFEGNNHLELSKKYGCTLQWIYKVVRTMHKIKQNEVQGDLFGEEDE